MFPKILIVEDDDTISEIYAMKFELEGFPVAVAENGQIALERFESFHPQIILLDMMMPVMGGLEFLQRLQDKGRKLPFVIVFSNISAPGQVEAIMKLGASDYWVKSDYTPERVIQELTKQWTHLQEGNAP